MGTFAAVTQNNPDLLCICGHPAPDHLDFGAHSCARFGCDCPSFELEASLENVLILVRGPAAHFPES